MFFVLGAESVPAFQPYSSFTAAHLVRVLVSVNGGDDGADCGLFDVAEVLGVEDAPHRLFVLVVRSFSHCFVDGEPVDDFVLLEAAILVEPGDIRSGPLRSVFRLVAAAPTVVLDESDAFSDFFSDFLFGSLLGHHVVAQFSSPPFWVY